MTELAAARAGFAGLGAAPEVQAAALAHLERWLREPPFRAYGMQLRALIAAGRWATLLDCFYRVLPFGTGGRRGRVGVGPNRFNPYTLAASVQGHAAWLRARHGPGPLKVVVAGDTRQFHDLGGELIPDVPSPVTGLRSWDFVEVAAETYAAAGITVLLPPVGEPRSTPELSHAIRATGAVAGLVISASHNPPDDNGGKLYTAAGGQAVAPMDQELSDEVDRVHTIDRMSLDRARAAGLIEPWPAGLHRAWMELYLPPGAPPVPGGLAVVFTPLHGTGGRTVAPLLRAAGVRLWVDPQAEAPDGAFPSVPHRCPNPELPRTMDAATRLAEAVGADLVMATDPDADRLGLRARGPGGGGGWRSFSGDEIGALVTHAALLERARRGPGGRPALVLTTEVTSPLIARVAALHGARVIDHLPVGFKHLGEALGHIEADGRACGVDDLQLDDFAVAVEESHGVLTTAVLRDKDAAGGALALARLAAAEKARGRTLSDTLAALEQEVGPVATCLLSTPLRGFLGRQRIQGIQASLRADPPAALGGRRVRIMSDRQDPDGPLGPLRSATDASSRDALVFHLDGGARVVVRPSGTEPKNKVYVAVPGAAGAADRGALQAAARALGEAVVLECLRRVQVELPAWALSMEEPLTIEDRVAFVTGALPGALERAERPAELRRWLREALPAFGPGAAALALPGLLRAASEDPRWAPIADALSGISTA
jgi:phosphoglucomutase